jgi:quercetin dioxygenase-like cupin family protein
METMMLKGFQFFRLAARFSLPSDKDADPRGNFLSSADFSETVQCSSINRHLFTDNTDFEMIPHTKALLIALFDLMKRSGRKPQEVVNQLKNGGLRDAQNKLNVWRSIADSTTFLDTASAVAGGVIEPPKPPTLPKLSEIVKVLEAFGYTDLETFLDVAWHFDGRMKPLLIQSTDRDRMLYNNANRNSAYRDAVKAAITEKWKENHLNPKGHRVLMEKVVLPPGNSSTKGGTHYGQEAIYVLKGEVLVILWNHNENSQTFELLEGDFFSFNSLTHHSAINKSEDSECVIMVSRTLRSNDYLVSKQETTSEPTTKTQDPPIDAFVTDYGKSFADMPRPAVEQA